MIAIQKYKSILALLIFLSIMGCKDDDKPNQDSTVTEESLITNNWRVNSVTRDGQLLSSTSFKIEFKANKSYEFNTSEVPGFPQGGNWVYQPSTKTIKLDGSTDLRVIGTITQNSFKFEYTYYNHKMGEVKVEFSLVPA